MSDCSSSVCSLSPPPACPPQSYPDSACLCVDCSVAGDFANCLAGKGWCRTQTTPQPTSTSTLSLSTEAAQVHVGFRTWEIIAITISVLVGILLIILVSIVICYLRSCHRQSSSSSREGNDQPLQVANNRDFCTVCDRSWDDCLCNRRGV